MKWDASTASRFIHPLKAVTSVTCSIKSERGYSMVELLISVAVMSIVIGATLGSLSKGQVTSKNEQESTDMTQNARVAFDTITQDLRLAGSGLPRQYAIVAASATSLTVRGNFSSTSTIAGTVDATTGVLVVGSTKGFSAGQTVSLTDKGSGAIVLTTLSAVGATTLTVSTSATSLTPGTALESCGPGTAIEPIERVTYRLDNGAISRISAPELAPSSVKTDTISESALDSDTSTGLKFRYYDGAGLEMTDLSVLSDIASIEMDLKHRTLDKDGDSRKYRVLRLKLHVRPRNQ